MAISANSWRESVAAAPGEDSASTDAGAGEFRASLLLLTGFWIFAAVSNVLYANNMRASLELMGVEQVFAPWESRLLQHLMLYPPLVGAIWLSRRIGWQPWWRTVPLQAVCALLFSALATPALVAAEMLTGATHMHMAGAKEEHWSDLLSGPPANLWLAGVSSFVVTYCFALALVAGFGYYRRYRDAELHAAALEQSLTAAKLAALRMQLSPHTLFNLLHTIRGQIVWDPPAAQSMVVQLADLLRRLLRAGERELVTLRDELEFARLYLQLQQQRFSDRLTTTVTAVDNVAAAWVPSLILQPLVENAVVHGLAGHEGPVRIDVEAQVHGEALEFVVRNTVGAGIKLNAEGIGLRNVRDRLAIQFGPRASFAAGIEGDRWVARLSLPLLRDERPRT